MRPYQPRPQSRRWLDADCPRGVLAIFDDRSSGDRYTIFYRELYGRTPTYTDGYMWGRGCSAHPSAPQGVGLTIEMHPWEVANYRYHNAHRKARWSDLPPDVQRLVRDDLTAKEP